MNMCLYQEAQFLSNHSHGVKMSKKYTLKETRQILRDVLCGSFEHMEAIKAEIRKLGPEEELHKCPDKMARAKVMTLTLTCINDIIHPAHQICRQLFKEHKEMLDIYVRNQKIAMERKMVPECYCNTCMEMKQQSSDKPVHEMVK